MKIGTKKWGKMNQRRAALIHKNVRGTITPAEKVELDRLQAESLQAVEKQCPHPVLRTYFPIRMSYSYKTFGNGSVCLTWIGPKEE